MDDLHIRCRLVLHHASPHVRPRPTSSLSQIFPHEQRPGLRDTSHIHSTQSRPEMECAAENSGLGFVHLLLHRAHHQAVPRAADAAEDATANGDGERSRRRLRSGTPRIRSATPLSHLLPAKPWLPEAPQSGSNGKHGSTSLQRRALISLGHQIV